MGDLKPRCSSILGLDWRSRGRLDTAQGPRLNLKQASRRRVLFFMNQEQRYQAFALLALTVVVAIWSVF